MMMRGSVFSRSYAYALRTLIVHQFLHIFLAYSYQPYLYSFLGTVGAFCAHMSNTHIAPSKNRMDVGTKRTTQGTTPAGHGYANAIWVGGSAAAHHRCAVLYKLLQHAVCEMPRSRGRKHTCLHKIHQNAISDQSPSPLLPNAYLLQSLRSASVLGGVC